MSARYHSRSSQVDRGTGSPDCWPVKSGCVPLQFRAARAVLVLRGPRLWPGLVGILVLALAPRPLRADLNNYVQTNLVSDIPGLAASTDPNLVNRWGIAFGPTSPFCISDNHTGLSTLYRGSGEIVPLVV